MRIEPTAKLLLRRFEWLLCGWLLACVAAFVAISVRWPLAGDVSYMHYVVFLMQHGMVPYRDIVEMNLPGTYMMETAVIAVLGPGSAGWRTFDFLLLGAAGASMLTILRPYGRPAVVFAFSLFLLVHAQDGVIMAGQRDFVVAAFLLGAVAMLLTALRNETVRWRTIVAAGVCLGMAIAIKPTVLPLILLLIWWVGWTFRRRARGSIAPVGHLVIGVFLPLSATALFLWKHHGVAAFWEALHGLIPYHASLGHKSASFLAGHSVSPLMPMVVVWVAALVVLKTQRRAEGLGASAMSEEYAVLLFCAAGGLLSYLLQQKGFSYQRYPFLAFLLPLMAIDFFRLVPVRNGARLVGLAGLVCGAVLAGIFVVRIARFDRHPPAGPLLNDLIALGVQQRQVQCMDTAGSCIADLRAGKIVQSTGFIYDCYLLDGANPVATDLRRRFWEQLGRNPPRLIVVTDSVCFDLAPSFDKYGKWPEFERYLAEDYTVARQSGDQAPVRYWSRSIKPFGYRIYVRR